MECGISELCTGNVILFLTLGAMEFPNIWYSTVTVDTLAIRVTQSPVAVVLTA